MEFLANGLIWILGSLTGGKCLWRLMSSPKSARAILRVLPVFFGDPNVKKSKSATSSWIQMSFPWNVPLENIQMLVSLSLTVSGILVSAAYFLLGIYLSKYKDLSPKGELRLFAGLIFSLVALPILTIIMVCIVILFSCQEMWLKTYLLTLMLTPLVPAVTITAVLMWKYPSGG